MKAATLQAIALSLVWALAVATAAYAVIRFIQFFVYPDPNPALLVWSAHAGFFWRCWTCGYAGALAGFVAFVASRDALARSAHLAARAVVCAAVLLSLQVAFFP